MGSINGESTHNDECRRAAFQFSLRIPSPDLLKFHYGAGLSHALVNSEEHKPSAAHLGIVSFSRGCLSTPVVFLFIYMKRKIENLVALYAAGNSRIRKKTENKKIKENKKQ